MSNKNIKSFYNNCWSDNSSLASEESHLVMRKKAVDYSMKLMGELKNKKFLEVGVGSGKQAMFFASKGLFYYGVDISDSSIDIIKSKFKRFGLKGNLQLGNSEKLAFKDKTFDRVYFNSLIMHVDHEKTILEISRVLKKGGSLVFLEPMSSNPFLWVYRTFFSKYDKLKPDYFRYDEISKYSKFFSKFFHKEFYLFSTLFLLVFSIFKNKNCYVSIVNFFENFDRLLITILPFFNRFCWVSVVRFVK